MESVTQMKFDKASKRFLFRTSEDLFRALKRYAERKELTLNGALNKILEKSLKDKK